MKYQSIPYVTADQMREVDRLMVEKYGIQLIQMMEVAGRQLAVLAVSRFLEDDPVGKNIVILAGSGGNGGGALVCARNLHNWGARVGVFLSRKTRNLEGLIRQQVDILDAYPLDVSTADELDEFQSGDLIIDGIIGYSLNGPPRGSAAAMIRWANARQTPVLALDVPSGLDATTGEVHHPAVEAAATLTLALPKVGLQSARPDIVGDLYLGDIGVPPVLYSEPTLKLVVGPLFQKGQIIRLNP